MIITIEIKLVIAILQLYTTFKGAFVQDPETFSFSFHRNAVSSQSCANFRALLSPKLRQATQEIQQQDDNAAINANSNRNHT